MHAPAYRQSVRATLPTDDVSQVTGMSSGRGESAALSVVARATDEEGTHRGAGNSSGNPSGAMVWMRCCNSLCRFRFRFIMAIDTAVRNAATLTHSGTHVGVTRGST